VNNDAEVASMGILCVEGNSVAAGIKRLVTFEIPCGNDGVGNSGSATGSIRGMKRFDGKQKAIVS